MLAGYHVAPDPQLGSIFDTSNRAKLDPVSFHFLAELKCDLRLGSTILGAFLALLLVVSVLVFKLWVLADCLSRTPAQSELEFAHQSNITRRKQRY